MYVYLSLKRKLNAPVQWQFNSRKAHIYIWTYMSMCGKKVLKENVWHYSHYRTIRIETRFINNFFSTKQSHHFFFSIFFSSSLLQLIFTGFLTVGNNVATIFVFFSSFIFSTRKKRVREKKPHARTYTISQWNTLLCLKLVGS